jgi:hypothetical protein
MLTCMALMAFAAFASMPALASASPVLTENGVKVVPPQLVVATAKNTTFTSSSTVITCETSTLTGTVTTNSGTAITGDITKAEFHNAGGAPCSSSLGAVKVTVESLPWCIHSGAADIWTLNGGACPATSGTIAFTLDLEGFGGFPCKYTRSAAVEGTFATNTTPANLKTKAGTNTFTTTQGFPCPASGVFEANYSLETENGTALTIS